MTDPELRSRLQIIALVLFAIGMGTALLIYMTADDVAPDAIGYIVVDGLKYPIEPGQSKRYVRDLERFGGKASVLFDELGRWFTSIWQGRRLGVTIGCLTLLLTAGLSLFARSLKK